MVVSPTVERNWGCNLIEFMKKKISDEKEREEEKYRFIKEQIKPQRKKRIIKNVNKLIFTTFLAIIFGSVSAIAFCSVKNIMENDKKKSKTVSNDALAQAVMETTTPAPANSSSIDSAKSQTTSHSDVEKIYDYSKLNKKMAAIGDSYKHSLVTVSAYNDLNFIIETDNSNVSYGLIVQEDANSYYILTQISAIDSEKSIKIKFYNGDIANASLVASDNTIELAVINVKKKNIKKVTKSSIVIAGFSDITGNLAVGTNIIAVGAPNGIMYSVMLGNIIKSNIETSVTDNKITLYTTDIIASSKSSGIILNTKGQVIGIITDLFKDVIGENVIGFIEISSIQDMIKLLIKGQNIAYLGMEGRDIDEATAQNNSMEAGIYVTFVYSNSPAYSAGMRAADVITEIDGNKVLSLKQLHNALMVLKPDDKITLTIARKVNKKTTFKKLKAILE